MSKYARKVALREGRLPEPKEYDFGLLEGCSDLWDALYNEGGATFERMDDGDVWLNSDNNLSGPVVIYEETNDYEGNRQVVRLTLYDGGKEIAQAERPEPEDWFTGPYQLVRDWARSILNPEGA
jgi:hypothetical protein